MNIGEAGDFNTVIRYVLGHRDPTKVDLDDIALDQDVEEAAARLADRAHKALGAGWRGEDVRAAWADALFGPWVGELVDYESVRPVVDVETNGRV